MPTREKGFSTFGVILLLATLIGIVAVGVIVFNKDSEKRSVYKEDNSFTEPIVKSKSKPQDPKSYLLVPEWGIKIPNDTGQKLTYKVVKRGTSEWVAFRSEALDKVSGDCTTNSINVVRGAASDKVLNEVGSNAGTTFLDAYNAVDKTTLGQTNRSIAVHVGDFYYVVPSFAGSSCATSQEGVSAEELPTNMIVKAINKLTLAN